MARTEICGSSVIEVFFLPLQYTNKSVLALSRTICLQHLTQSTTSYPISLSSILILSSDIRLGFPSGLFPSGFLTRSVHLFSIFPMRATCPAHFIVLCLRKFIRFHATICTLPFTPCRVYVHKTYRHRAQQLLSCHSIWCYFNPKWKGKSVWLTTRGTHLLLDFITTTVAALVRLSWLLHDESSCARLKSTDLWGDVCKVSTVQQRASLKDNIISCWIC